MHRTKNEELTVFHNFSLVFIIIISYNHSIFYFPNIVSWTSWIKTAALPESSCHPFLTFVFVCILSGFDHIYVLTGVF